MSTTKRGLGRGLGALISAEERDPLDSSGGMFEVPLDAIAPNPHQPRQAIDGDTLRELADSIREHGVIQPLVVTRSVEGDGEGRNYQLIAGERRLRAAGVAGLSSIPVIVREATSQQQLEWALVENLQRADLNPLETAGAYRMLMDEFGLTHEQVAEEVGKSRSAVTNALRLLRLPDEIKAVMLSGQISEGHARALQGLSTPDAQLMALVTVLRRSLSVRQTEELVRRTLAHLEKEGQQKDGEEAIREAWEIETQALEERFRNVLGTKVSLARSKRGGKLVIQFYSEEELQRIYELIVGEE